jgi:hypothetical protein
MQESSSSIRLMPACHAPMFASSGTDRNSVQADLRLTDTSHGDLAVPRMFLSLYASRRTHGEARGHPSLTFYSPCRACSALDEDKDLRGYELVDMNLLKSVY